MTIQNWCRICLKPSKNMYALYGSDSDTEKSKIVLEVLQAFVRSPVRPTDHASPNICNDCLKQILSTHSFMTKCRQSDKVFRQLSRSRVHLKRLNDPINFLEYVIDVKKPEAKINSEDAPKEDEIICNGFFNNENRQTDLNFESDKEIQSDEEQETSDDILQCPACPYVFGAIKDLRTHLIEVHTKNLCILCDNEYFEDIWHHTRLHVPRSQVCNECGRKFILKSTLLKHSKSHCKFCFMSFATKNELDKHTNDFHKFDCRICFKSFRHKAGITRHLAEHYSFNEIGENYLVAKENSFENAAKSDSALEYPEMFGNDLADKLLGFSPGILSPNKISNNPPKKLFKCKLCPKEYRGKKSLVEHMNVHRGERPLADKLLGFSPGILSPNKISNNPAEKLFKCKLCPKEYRAKKSLVEHMNVHSGERPLADKLLGFSPGILSPNKISNNPPEKLFKCKLCPKEYRAKKSLVEHMNVHSGERPFSCSLCNKSFRAKRSLRKHLISHSKKIPYVCGICKKKFKIRASVCSHLERMHGPLNFLPCGVCDEKFENKKELYAHWNCVHKLCH